MGDAGSLFSEPTPTAVEVRSLNHWTAREDPSICILKATFELKTLKRGTVKPVPSSLAAYMESSLCCFYRTYFCFWIFPYEPQDGSHFQTPSFLYLPNILQIPRAPFLVLWLVSHFFILATLQCRS